MDDTQFDYFGNRTPSSEYYYDTGYAPSVVKMTLDWRCFERMEIPLSDNADMTDEGTILFDTFDLTGDNTLVEYLRDGTFRNIWECAPVFGY